MITYKGIMATNIRAMLRDLSIKAPVNDNWLRLVKFTRPDP